MPFLFPPTRVIAARYKNDVVGYNTLKSAVCVEVLILDIWLSIQFLSFQVGKDLTACISF